MSADGDAIARGPAFAKGHGTGNDFVLLPDPDGRLDLTARRVQALCDRRFGVGADGVLRMVRAAQDPDSAGMAGDAEWFMDYRNGDGSVAEMCGNGARVFARYLVQEGLAVSGPGVIATRSGVLPFDVPDGVHGDVTIGMGAATTPRLRARPRVRVGERSWPATGVLVPNPHAVVFVDDLIEAGALTEAPEITPYGVFPDGANVEFVVPVAPGHIRMRVHERGVGETLSCGTGAVAAAWVARRRQDPKGGQAKDVAWQCRVDVPGGTVHVIEHPDGRLDLVGPAQIVARGHLDPTLWDPLT